MKNLIGFFSSDARPLYKEDIYRSLALPKNSIIHFRYGQNYIQEDLVSNISSLIGKNGVIFFVTGNDLNIPENERKKESISIRKVCIKSVSKSVDTKHFHFSLELLDYVDCSILKTETEKYVSKISINEGISHAWIDRVKAVRDSFQDVLFFKYELFDKENHRLPPVFDKISEDSIFKVEDEKEYKLIFSFFDKNEGKSSLIIEDSQHIDVHYKEGSNIGAVIDDRTYRLVTKTLQQFSKPDSLKIKPSPIPKDSDLKYEVISLFEIKKRLSSSIFFGVLSALAFSSILLSQVVGAFVKDNKPVWQIITVSTLAIVLFGIAGAILFNRFNKK